MKKIQLLKFSVFQCILIGLFTLFSGWVFSQIDSMSVQLETGLNPYTENDTVDVMKIEVNGYNVSAMGSLQVMVYELEYGNLVANLIYTTTQLTAQSLLSGTMSTLRVYEIDPSLNYRIEVLVKNTQGGNYPLITTNYDAE